MHVQRDHQSLGLYLAGLLFGVLAALQALYLARLGAAPHMAAALAAAAATWGALWWRAAPLRRRCGWVLAMAIVAGVNVVWHLARAGDAAAEAAPTLRASVLYGYAAVWLATLASLLSRRVLTGLFVSAIPLAAGLVVLDSVAHDQSRALLRKPVVRWVGGTVRHPVLQEYYAPGSQATTLYDANPRQYFAPIDQRGLRWQLSLNDPQAGARLLLPEGTPQDAVRVEIDRAGAQPWHVQLSFNGVSAPEGEGLLLALRLRAERPRPVALSLAQAHAPWNSLGLYRTVEIGPQWQDVVIPFEVRGRSDKARIVLDLAQDSAAVEVASVVLRERRSSRSVIDELPREFAVHYRFNDRGCRGPSVPVPAPAGHRRILLLGDSFTLGVGVHEPDTFAARLQALLNADGQGVRYDVINCAVSGYATRQERQMYELQAAHYRPDVVIVSMVMNDVSSWVDDVEGGHFFVPGTLDRLFPVAGSIRQRLTVAGKPTADFQANVRELLELKALCDRDGAKLVVAAFRNMPLETDTWGVLVRNVSAGLQGSGTAWIDLGEEMLREHPMSELVVYPDGDAHPNEVAHLSAARQLARLLRDQGWVR